MCTIYATPPISNTSDANAMSRSVSRAVLLPPFQWHHLRIHPKHAPTNKDAFSSIKRLTRKGQANKLATLTYACTKADKQANVRRHVEGVNRNGQYYCGRTKRGVSRESSDWTYRFTGGEARLVVVGDCLSCLC